MSLLLDALNRASKEKQKAAAAASQAEASVTVPAPLATPVESLKWEEIPPLASVPEHAAPAETPRASPPVLTASVPSDSALELTLVDTPPAAEPALEPAPAPVLSAPPAVPPE